MSFKQVKRIHEVGYTASVLSLLISWHHTVTPELLQSSFYSLWISFSNSVTMVKFELILAAMLVTSYHVDNRPTTKPVHSVRGKLCQRRLKETDWKKMMTWSQWRSLSFTCSRTLGEYRHSKLHSSLSEDQTTESNSKEMQRFLISYLRLIFHFLLH